MEIAKLMPRYFTVQIARLLKACMKFSPEHRRDLDLWAKLDKWIDNERGA